MSSADVSIHIDLVCVPLRIDTTADGTRFATYRIRPGASIFFDDPAVLRQMAEALQVAADDMDRLAEIGIKPEAP